MVRRSEVIVIPLAALLARFLAFSLLLLLFVKSPVEFSSLVYRAGFGTSFSWQNNLSRTAPLLLTALCVALPARLGLVVIGGEGAIVLGGVATGAVGLALAGWPAWLGLAVMAPFDASAGTIWIGAVGVLRYWRGVNETIASLLMAYIAIALMNHLVECPLRDPASLNKPSTVPLSEALRVGDLPGWDVHWGLVAGVALCVLSWMLIDRTTWRFTACIAGTNIRAAQVQGLPLGWLIVGFTALGGAIAGLAGMFEFAAVHGAANISLTSGHGFTGILIAFLARHIPRAIIPWPFYSRGSKSLRV